MHIIKWKKPIWEGYIPTRRHSREDRMMEKVKRSMVSRDKVREKGMDGYSPEELCHGEVTLCDTAVGDTCPCTFVQTQRMDNTESNSSDFS